MTNRRRSPLLAILASLFTTLILTPTLKPAAGAEPAPGSAATPFRIIGYLPDYRVARINPAIAPLLTDVLYFSWQPTADGGLNRSELTETETRVLREFRRQGVRVHLSLGGGNRSDHFATVAASDELRKRFCRNLFEAARKLPFDGIDVDWEFPADDRERADFGRLMADLKSTLAPANMELSIAVSGWQELPPEVINAVDFVHLMAYDGGERHSTFDYAVAESERVIKRGVPAARLSMGLPFYGRAVANRDQTVTYAEAVRRFQPGTADEAGGYFFNGPETIARKVRWARERGLAGVMIWELGQDARGEASLLKAIHAAVTADTTEPAAPATSTDAAEPAEKPAQEPAQDSP